MTFNTTPGSELLLWKMNRPPERHRWSVYLLVSCLRRASCAPRGCWGRWESWEMTELRVLTPEVRPVSSGATFSTVPKSPSSSTSTSSASFSAPSLSDAGPKWVCSSGVRCKDPLHHSWVRSFFITHTHWPWDHTLVPGINIVTAAWTARLMMLSIANIQWGLMWWFLRTLFTLNTHSGRTERG